MKTKKNNKNNKKLYMTSNSRGRARSRSRSRGRTRTQSKKCQCSYKLNSIKKNMLLEKEVLLLRNAVEIAEKKKKSKMRSPIMEKIFNIVETFIKDKKLICYGGIAINNILPKKEQFYDINLDYPDYDFFSPNSMDDAKELADIYFSNGFEEVEAKAGIHTGTYKIYVNFISVADITFMDSYLFTILQKNSITKKNIYYAPPNFLRMSAYLELSRPDGDISRWEKIWKRLVLLNMYFPIKTPHCNITTVITNNNTSKNKNIYNIILNSIISQKLVIFGAYALLQYNKYINNNYNNKYMYPDFDVLALDPFESSNIMKNELLKHNILNIEIKQYNSIGELIPEHYEIIVDNESYIYLYKTTACHSYNTTTIKNKSVNIASIDTMLSFYFAFLYSNKKNYDTNRIMCICENIFNIQIKNRLSQKGLLKRFSTKCYGVQDTLQNIRARKSFLYNELKKKRCGDEFNKYFFRYMPGQRNKCFKKYKKSKTSKTSKTSKLSKPSKLSKKSKPSKPFNPSNKSKT
jgi:hypothetical protein